MGNSKWKLGWFNAWVGFIWIFLLIHSFKFFFAYESFLQRSFAPALASQVRIEIKNDSSEMKIITDKGVFYHYNKRNYQIIENYLNEHIPVEIWYDKEDRNTADFRAKEQFLLKRTVFEIVLYLISLVISGGMVVLSTILVIQTKGWGTYELMEKHRKRD